MDDNLFYLYIKAVIGDDGYLAMDTTNTLIDSELMFLDKVNSNLELLNDNTDGFKIVNLFCILGETRDLNYKMTHYKTYLLDLLFSDNNNFFVKFIHPYCEFINSSKLVPNVVRYKIDDDISCHCFYGAKELCDDIPEYIDTVFQFWLDREQPVLAGKQIMTLPFRSQDLIGRKAVSLMSSTKDGDLYLILEGNIKIKLAHGNINYIDMYDTDSFNVNDVQDVLYNPIYSYGFTFEPYVCYREWFDVFLYGIATLDIDLDDLDKLEKLYNSFFEFIEQSVCNRLNVSEAIIEKRVFFEASSNHISTTRQFLCAKEEEVVSKNIILRMRSKWTYLDTMYSLIKYIFPKAVETRLNTQPFNINLWRTFLDNLRPKENHLKGKAMEDLAYYFLNAISGLKITGRNIRYFTEELDLCCCNISNDPVLWKMGALVLVECKNRKENTSVSTIRNLSHIMDAKGATTIILFTYSRVTEPAIKEIEKQLTFGKNFICLELSDLKSLCETRTPDDLLREKLEKPCERIAHCQ
jgi:Holliday junction resolvase-like predicted endonuclease